MDQEAIIQYVTETFRGVDVVQPGPEDEPAIARGDTFFIYDPDCSLDATQRFPFATVVTKDYGEFDCASNLNRPSVYRLNIGVSKGTYRAMFGPQPASVQSGVVATGHDFAALDVLMPHPFYAPQSWICILNPSDTTFEQIKPLLAEAYQRTVSRLERRDARH